MVFNPTFEGSVRFNQPVAPGPTGAEVLANIVGGLGVFDTIANARQGPAAPSNLTESWQRYSAETGASPNIANATSAELRGFAGFDPRYADDAISLNEQLGNSGFQQQRAEQERSVEFLNSHVGVLESNRAANLYPDDPEAQAAHVAQAELDFYNREESHRRLQQESDATGYRANISDEAWDIEQGYISSVASELAYEFVELAPAILGGGVSVDQLGPELQAMLPGFTTINSGNLALAASTLRDRLIRGFHRDLQSRFPNAQINSADSDYVSDVFATFDTMVTRLTESTDPNAELERIRSTGQLRVMDAIGPEGRAWVNLMELMPNSQVMQDFLLEHASADMVGVAERMVQAARGSMLVDFSDASVGEARVGQEMALGFLTEFSRGRDNSPASRGALVGMVNTVVATAERTGVTRIGDDVYDVLTNPTVLGELRNQAGGEEAIQNLSSLFLSDFSTDIGNVRAQAEDSGFTIVFENGRFSLGTPEIVDDQGATLGSRRPNSVLNRQVQQINQRLEQIGDEGLQTLLGDQFSEILAAGAMEGPSQVGPGAEMTVPTPDPNARAGALAAPATQPQRPGQPRLPQATPAGNGAAGIATNLLREFEGFSEDTYWDVNAHRLGFGSDTITRADGTVVRVQEGMTVTRQDAERDLNRRLTQEFMPMARNGVGPQVFDSLAPSQQAVLASLSYNYGNEWGGDLANVTAALQSGNLALAEQEIRALSSHNAGVNTRRRNIEADIFAQAADMFSQQIEPIDYTTQPQYSPNAVMLQEGIFINPGIALNGNANATLDMTNASRLTREYAGERMQNETIPAFMRMQQIFGGTIAINDAIAQAGTSRENSTTGSRHFHGDALDLDISGMSNEEKLRAVQAAYAAGFRGFGFGDGILHIDLGTARSWAYGNDTFAGMPLSEVQAMVADGRFAGLTPIADDTGAAFNPVATPADRERYSALAGASAPDSDPGQGEPSNFQTYDLPEAPQEVEQGSEATQGTVTPEQGGDASQAAAQRLSGAPVDTEVQELITALTTGASEQELEALREQLRALMGETRR
jgi:GH24 family phage-related lysozyme (muramidase)